MTELPLNQIIQGDALTELKKLPSESVDCVVTSPPYYGLRDYGVDGQLGLEKSYQEYISNLCDIFDEVKRVLKKEGTCWVNIGDSYSTSHETGTTDAKTGWKSSGNDKNPRQKEHARANGGDIPTKSLMQIPSRFSIEMSNRGWILRNEIIWHKPNCMPSSVKDRFTVDFEKVFFFVKNKKYWFETQYEPIEFESIRRERRAINKAGKPYAIQKNKAFTGYDGVDNEYKNHPGRNKRAVWKIATKPFKEAHFPTYPESLIEPMIKAGCPVGGTVLDPFFGAGTTGLVAMKQGKKYIGIELNPEYIKIAEKRLAQETLI